MPPTCTIGEAADLDECCGLYHSFLVRTVNVDFDLPLAVVTLAGDDKPVSLTCPVLT